MGRKEKRAVRKMEEIRRGGGCWSRASLRVCGVSLKAEQRNLWLRAFYTFCFCKIPVLTSRLFVFFLHFISILVSYFFLTSFPLFYGGRGLTKAVFPPVPCSIRCSCLSSVFRTISDASLLPNLEVSTSLNKHNGKIG